MWNIGFIYDGHTDLKVNELFDLFGKDIYPSLDDIFKKIDYYQITPNLRIYKCLYNDTDYVIIEECNIKYREWINDKLYTMFKFGDNSIIIYDQNDIEYFEKIIDNKTIYARFKCLTRFAFKIIFENGEIMIQKGEYKVVITTHDIILAIREYWSLSHASNRKISKILPNDTFDYKNRPDKHLLEYLMKLADKIETMGEIIHI